jgi:branched-chain amino acid transport system permease protein
MSTAAAAAGRVAPSQLRWRPDARGWVVRIGVLACLLAAASIGVAALPSYWADRVALAAIFGIIGLSLNIVLGYSGQVSLGHHAFVGLSAFVSAILVTEQKQSFWVGLAAAILVGTVSAGLLGLVALRIKGLYLALITLTYGFVAVNSIFEIPSLTRGGAGMPAPRPAGFTTEHRFAMLCFAFLALAIFVDWRLVKSKTGRAIIAIKQSEAVAASYGVNVTAYKVLGFMLSGALAGLAGSLFAHRVETVVAADFNFRDALVWVLMVVVGGLGSRVGVVIGSMFFALFPYLVSLSPRLEGFIRDTLQRDPDELMLVVGPLLALLTIIRFPGGIAEQISPVTRWFAGNRFTLHPDGRTPKTKSRAPLKERLGVARIASFANSDGKHSVRRSESSTPESEPVASSKEQK